MKTKKQNSKCIMIIFLQLMVARDFADGSVSLDRPPREPPSISSGRGPFLTVAPPAKLSFSNSTGAILPCSAEGTNPPPEISWISQDGRLVREVPGVVDVYLNGSLYFPPFAPQLYDTTIHDAIFRCRATSNLGTIISEPVQVRGVVVGDYEVQVYDQLVMVGNIGVLRCSVPSYVKEYVTVTSWLHDSAFNIYPSLHGDGKYQMTPSGELLVLNVSPQDGHSRFQCRTLHTLTGATRLSRTRARVIVTEPQGSVPPRISERAPHVTSSIGSDVILPCIAQGHPPPQYSWYHGSAHTQVSERSWVVGGSLVLVGIGPDDAGEYHCVANNSAGTSRYSIHLAVSIPLSVQVTPAKTEVDSGKSLELRCHVSGHPVDTITWYKDGSIMRSSERVRLRPRHLLSIYPVEKSDTGVYQCEASTGSSFAIGTSYVSLGAAIPTLSYRFISQTLQPGPSVSLKCIGSGTPTPHISWTLDGFPLPQSHRFLIGQYVSGQGDVISHVNISSVRVSDGGMYRCEAKNDAGSVHHGARLNVYGPPQVRPLGRMSAVAGEDFDVTCPVGGHPIEKVVWKKDGIRLPGNHRQRALSNGSLTIRKVNKNSDSGTYSCTAFDRQGRSNTQTLILSVIVAPLVLPFAFDSGLVSGDRVGVACIVSKGDPPIMVKWTKDGRPLSQLTLPGLSVMSNSAFSSTLMVDNLTSKHSGNYTCKATNTWAESKHTAELRVNVPPSWVSEPSGGSVSLGGSVTLECLAKGFPDPKISWKRETVSGEFVNVGVDLSMGVRAFGNGTLGIIRAERRHEGRYLCEANNGVGGGISKVITLHVNEPPWFALRSQRLQVEVDSLAKLTCQAKGDPPLNIIWTRDSAPLPPYPRYEVSEKEFDGGTTSELLVRRAQVQDSGVFVCEASNPHGSLSSDFHLVVQDVPFPPSELTIVEKGSRHVTLGWTSPSDSNAEITSFIVTYSPQWTERKEGLPKEMTVEGDSTKVRVDGLWPATTYSFTVAAENKVGRSSPSAPIREVTLEEVPKGYPRNVRVSAISSTALQVTWDPPKESESHGLILGYYLGYKDQSMLSPDEAASGAYNFTTVGVEGLGVTSTTLTSLKPFTNYSVVLQAFNSRGAGPSSPPTIAFTLEDKPDAPPSSVVCESLSPTQLKISWSEPPAGKTNGRILSYRVIYRLENPKEEHDGSGMVISEIMSTTISDLQPWSNFSISVAASTRAGEGDPSDPIICTTLEDVPNAPDRIKAVASGPNSVTVSWSIPKHPNGRIAGYTVYWLQVGRKARPLSRYVEASNIHLTLHDISSSPNEVWVTASTGVGEGPSSEVIVVTPTAKVSAGVWSVGGNVTIGWKEDVQMTCHAVGKPEPKLTWTHAGKPVPQSSQRYSILPDGTLRIIDTQKSDSGTYICTATNIHGIDRAVYSLKILVPPSRPSLHVTETTSSSIRLQWSIGDDGGAPIRRSNLFYRPHSGETLEAEILGSRNSHTVENLKCGTSHYFFVTTTNKIGTSDASKEVEARTKGRAPEAPPPFQFVTTNSSQATLYLTQWEDGGCPITHFQVEYRRVGLSGWTTVGSKIPPSRTYAVGGLTAGHKYQVRVKAFNAAGFTLKDYSVSTPAAGKAGFRETYRDAGEGWNLMSKEHDLDPNAIEWKDPRILVPGLISILAVMLTVVTVCICLRKKPLGKDIQNKAIPNEMCSAHGKNKGDLAEEYQIYSPIRRLPPTPPNPPPPSEARDSTGDFSEDDVYQYTTATYQVRTSSPPPPAPSSPNNQTHNRRCHPKGFTAHVYQPPSLHDVDAPNMGGRCSIPAENYMVGEASDTDDYGSLPEGEPHRMRQKQKTFRHKTKHPSECDNPNITRSENSKFNHVVRTPRSTLRSKPRQNSGTKSQEVTPVHLANPGEVAECDISWQ